MADREKLIELLLESEEQASKRGFFNSHKSEPKAELVADYLIANGVTFATDNNIGSKWIPVTERLPESQTDVLVVAFWHECWQTMIGWYSDSGKKWRVFTSHGEFEPGGVTHWMPLPEPPKEVE